jgi:hypothetical protein
MTDSMRCTIGVSPAGEGQVLLQERDTHPALGEGLHEPPQVVEVAGQAIHAVDHHCIALTHEGEQRCQRGPCGIFPGGRICIHAIPLHLLQVPLGVLL